MQSRRRRLQSTVKGDYSRLNGKEEAVESNSHSVTQTLAWLSATMSLHHDTRRVIRSIQESVGMIVLSLCNLYSPYTSPTKCVTAIRKVRPDYVMPQGMLLRTRYCCELRVICGQVVSSASGVSSGQCLSMIGRSSTLRRGVIASKVLTGTVSQSELSNVKGSVGSHLVSYLFRYISSKYPMLRSRHPHDDQLSPFGIVQARTPQMQFLERTEQ